MDSAPLVKAHGHARAAATATRHGSDTTVAITEHTHAAGEFANAAKDTSSAEALRTLRLLEAHHRRLAELLKLPPETTAHHADDEDEKAMTEKDGESRSGHQKGDANSPRTAHMPGLSNHRSTQREMSSSIASNLASARGIRSKYRVHPLSPSISNDNAPGNVDPHPRRDGSKTKMQSIIDHQSGKPSWVPPSAPASREHGGGSKPSSPRIDEQQTTREDTGYNAFYNAFGSIMNKISAPLAFAGLPLIQEESTVSETQRPSEADAGPSKHKGHSAGSTTTPVKQEVDLGKIYSKATMKALAREGHNPHESFYVVPTTGHTMSYANILNYAEKEKRRLVVSGMRENSGGSKDDDDDDFVDARESPTSLLSPGAQRRVGKGKTERELNNTIEELYTENQSLKDMLDKLSKRLQTFEASAQSSAMALAESYRLMRPASPTLNKHDDQGKLKMADTEQQLAAVTKQMERLEKDNRKMQKTLDKYREKWDVLKAGAKARRDGQKGMENIEEGI
ncbi:hypothetical protein VHEMI03385 [[Torrubiella] hemipterigena]|uniref:Uncharacterized protein n=1 Tax=[Torrubiella] hemipterigena TaxID=1531966 RepID=A0A0A1SSE5_9HYPO|nr:hypothetical protein VHEMI03385 [[Torrubiella] hemipterigena]